MPRPSIIATSGADRDNDQQPDTGVQRFPSTTPSVFGFGFGLGTFGTGTFGA